MEKKCGPNFFFGHEKFGIRDLGFGTYTPTPTGHSDQFGVAQLSKIFFFYFLNTCTVLASLEIMHTDNNIIGPYIIHKSQTFVYYVGETLKKYINKTSNPNFFTTILPTVKVLTGDE